MRNKIIRQILDETPKEVKIFIDLYADLVLRINQILKEKGITQKGLADRMEKQPSEINKWLNGGHNFTLRSIAKLQAELDEVLLEVSHKRTKSYFQEGSEKRIHSFMTYQSNHHKKVTEWTESEPQQSESANVA